MKHKHLIKIRLTRELDPWGELQDLDTKVQFICLKCFWSGAWFRTWDEAVCYGVQHINFGCRYKNWRQS